jgi:hypothetical protein
MVDSVCVDRGCLLRATVHLVFPAAAPPVAASSSAGTAAGDAALHGSSVSPPAPTASFSLVIHRDSLLRTGAPALCQAGVGSVPSGGHEGLSHSLVIHFLVKPLRTSSSGGDASPAGSPNSSVAQGGGAGDAESGSAAIGADGRPLDEGCGRFRIVAAVYGPPAAGGAFAEEGPLPSAASGSAASDGRTLLASGAVMEQCLPVVGLMPLGPAATAALNASAVRAGAPPAVDAAPAAAAGVCYALDVALEILPPPGATGGAAGVSDTAAFGWAAAGSVLGGGAYEAEADGEGGCRLHVSVLDRLAAVSGGAASAVNQSASTAPRTAGGGSSKASLHPAAFAAASRPVIDAAVDVDGCLGYARSAFRGLSRDRVWLGLTAPPAGGAPSEAAGPARPQPAVLLEALDFVAYADETQQPAGGDPLSSVGLHYRVPWPLHLVLTPPVMAQLQDLHALLLRGRRAAMSLHEAWRALMADFSAPTERHAPAPAASSPPAAARGRAGGGPASRGRGVVAPARGARGEGGRGGGDAVGGEDDDDASSVASAASSRSTLSQWSSASRLDAFGYSGRAGRRGRPDLFDIHRRAGAGGSGSGAGESDEAARQQRQEGRQRRQRDLQLRVSLHGLLRPVWLLRSRMAHVVEALLAFWQADVVEAAFAALMASVTAAPNYLALLRAHEAYMQALRSGCFMGQPSLLACADRIFGAVAAFCATLASSQGDLLALVQPGPGRDAVTRLSSLFSAESRMLVGLLHGAADHAEISSLLTRLGFNGFFG